jgi:hypothetical protein
MLYGIAWALVAIAAISAVVSVAGYVLGRSRLPRRAAIVAVVSIALLLIGWAALIGLFWWYCGPGCDV